MSESKIVVWGDSIPASGPNSWPETAEFIYNNFTNVGRTVKVINSSVGGKPAARAVNEFEERVAQFHPELVFIQFGFNDMRYDGKRGQKPISSVPEFGAHIREMIEDCKSIGAKVIVIGNHRPSTVITLPDGKSFAKKIFEYNNAAKEAALASKAVYFDMAEADIPGGSWFDLVCDDCVHLSEFGRSIYGQYAANLIYEYLK